MVWMSHSLSYTPKPSIATYYNLRIKRPFKVLAYRYEYAISGIYARIVFFTGRSVERSHTFSNFTNRIRIGQSDSKFFEEA